MSILGFTGTSRGMTPAQRLVFRQMLDKMQTLHLGDCVGADHDAWAEATFADVETIGHPPTDSKKRAYCLYDQERAPLPYLDRNRAIVFEGVDGLIATPWGYAEELRSGTWATVRYARAAKRHIWIIQPDGTIQEELCPS